MNSIMNCGNGIRKECFSAALLLASALTTCAYASSYTSASYVQREYLVAQWDGIDNAGTGTHDPETTIWKDLAGNHDLSLTNSATWRNGDRLVVSGVSAVGEGVMGAYKTIEVVYRMPVGLPSGRTLFTSGNSTTRQLVMFDEDIGISSGAQRGTLMYFSGEANVRHRCIERYSDDSLRFAAATFDDSSKTATEVFADGVLQTNPILKSNPWGNSGGFAMIGGMNKGDTSYMWHGEVLSIRLYSEKLTAEQIAANHAIDLARFGRQTPTSADYVSDGLIAHWDGIDNAGTGVHDPTATVWKDIANPVNGYDLDLTANGSWNSEGNALVVNGPSAKSTIAGPAYKTIEVVFKRADDTGRILFATGDKKRYVVQNKTSSGTTLVQFDGETNGKTRGTKVVKLPDRDTGVCFLSVRYDDVDNVTDILESADPCATSMYTNDWPSADGVLMIGDRNSNGGNFSWRGELYAIRLYNRRLTRAEMSRNHRIDCQRFLTSSSYISTNLVRTGTASITQGLGSTTRLHRNGRTSFRAVST